MTYPSNDIVIRAQRGDRKAFDLVPPRSRASPDTTSGAGAIGSGVQWRGQGHARRPAEARGRQVRQGPTQRPLDRLPPLPHPGHRAPAAWHRRDASSGSCRPCRHEACIVLPSSLKNLCSSLTRERDPGWSRALLEVRALRRVLGADKIGALRVSRLEQQVPVARTANLNVKGAAVQPTKE